MTTGEILAEWKSRSALVVGDVCLDRWCRYDPSAAEPSRETGIDRVAVVSTEVTPGAGGTVAGNLAALGVGRVAVLGAVGRDGFAMELRDALGQVGIEDELLFTDPSIQTFTYTKLLQLDGGAEDLPRVDFINTRPLGGDTERRLVESLRSAAGGFDAILVSDQAETNSGGVVTPAMRVALAEVGARHPEKVIWVDSRSHLEQFRRVTVKCNEEEAAAACRRAFGTAGYGRLRSRIEAPALVVTQGGAGALIIDERGERLVPVRAVANPVDICGAGDSFSAGAAMTLAVTRSIEEAARVGNLVASITIMKKGTGTASAEEVLEAAAAQPR